MSSFDVAIIGGGPGGAATAISLRAHAPSLSVVLIEASHYDGVRVGETLPPPARSILDHLKVWDEFCRLSPREVFGTSAAWGSTIPADNDFFYMPANMGWHLERNSFDAMLATVASERGATLVLDASLDDVEQSGDYWRLSLSTGATIRARFIVDASGSAVFARRCGARFECLDRLVGIVRFFEGSADDSRLLVEAFEHGWWYTAGLPDSKRIVACVTDADLVQRLKLGQIDEWERTLTSVPAVASRLQRCEPCGALMIRSSASRRLEPAAGEDWLAVGDSASRFDPLSSQGILKAMRGGIFASYAIGSRLLRDDDLDLRRYRRYVTEEFKSYSEARTKYYREEQRWPTSEFWRRRHSANGAEYNSQGHARSSSALVTLIKEAHQP
jgi:flavin-dependent dehydrogenase